MYLDHVLDELIGDLVDVAPLTSPHLVTLDPGVIQRAILMELMVIQGVLW